LSRVQKWAFALIHTRLNYAGGGGKKRKTKKGVHRFGKNGPEKWLMPIQGGKNLPARQADSCGENNQNEE